MSLLLLVVSMRNFDFEYPYVFCGKIFIVVMVACTSAIVFDLLGKGNAGFFVTEVIVFFTILLGLLKVFQIINENEREIIRKMDIPILKYILRYA